MFHAQFLKLCNECGVKPTPLLKSLGISATNLKRWENGSTVNSDILLKIAEHFDVSIDYLLGREEKKNIGCNSTFQNNGTVAISEKQNLNCSEDYSAQQDEMTKELVKRFNDLSFDEKLDVFSYIKNIK